MYRGRPWTIRQYAGFASAEESNERYRYLLARGQTGLSIAFDLPTQLGYDSDDPLALGEVGRTGVAIDSIADMEILLAGIPLGDVSTSMTINAPASLLLLLYELVAEEQGVPGTALRGTVQNDILKEYIARGNYIFPPRPSMRLDDRSVRLLRGADPVVEHDLDLRLPHPRGRLDRGAGARVHDRERHRLLRGRGRGGALARRLRRAAVVLLQRAQRLLPGGREVPRRAPPLGARDARAVRRDESEGARAALPRPDRRLDTDRAAAREQHRARRDPGAVGDRRRRAVAAHELVRRGARAARPSMRRRSRSARSRSSPTRPARPRPRIRSAARSTSRRSPTSSRRARGS